MIIVATFNLHISEIKQDLPKANKCELGGCLDAKLLKYSNNIETQQPTLQTKLGFSNKTRYLPSLTLAHNQIIVLTGHFQFVDRIISSYLGL